MSELIERLEKARGPDRRLDAQIVVALDIRPDWCGKKGHLWVDEKDHPNDPPIRLNELGGRNSRGNPPIGHYAKYTSSIDAALTLVPEGWEWSVSGGPNTISSAMLCRGGDHQDDEEIDCEGATPVIALCIAALKARAALTPSSQTEREAT